MLFFEKVIYIFYFKKVFVPKKIDFIFKSISYALLKIKFLSLKSQKILQNYSKVRFSKMIILNINYKSTKCVFVEEVLNHIIN